MNQFKGSQFKKSVLSNGVRVVTEQHAFSRSVSIGVWVLTGTRDEAEQDIGLSHFVEHLVFKGTKTRNAYQIAKSLESLGGDLNAYTTREYTNYHCLVLKEDWKIGLEVLSDLVCNMQLSKKDFELEKKVILQEIAMSDDTPEDLIYDYLFEWGYKNHPLGRQILGKSETIEKMTQKRVFEFYRHFYQGKNLIISAAGPVDHDQFVIQCQKFFKTRKKFTAKVKRRAPRWKPHRRIYEKDMEQAHVLLGLPAASFHDKYRFEAFILNTLLGGGMTSKLYQAVREKQGLAYTVFSSLNTNMDSANISVYAGTDASNVKKVVNIVAEELRKIKRNGFKKRELDVFKTQVRGQLLMGSDDIENRMASLGINEMIFQTYRSVEKVISEIDAVSEKSMREYIKHYFDLSKISVILMGPELMKHKTWLDNYNFER
ncbi:MAG: insulinase family protein [Bdellovibrionaceae bacterium]|nr:insulinase family protein [Bdellovibrio sp.]